MEIRVLGSGCNKCKILLDNVNNAVKTLNQEIKVIYVTDLVTIANFGLMNTPGLMFDNKIVSAGRVLSSQDVLNLISQFQK